MNAEIMQPLVPLVLLILAHTGHAEQDLLGLWLTENDESTVEITVTEEGWIGHIVALKEPRDPDGKNKTDYKNPDPNRRQDPIIGLRIIWGFEAQDNNTWTGGYVYDPNNGKTYHAKMTLQNRQLSLRGSLDRWGIVGRSTRWNRPASMEAP